jgi:hypothetical protein
MSVARTPSVQQRLSMEAPPFPLNNACEVASMAITPNGSATLPFVIPSAAEGSAVPRTIPGNVLDLAGNRILRRHSAGNPQH